MKHLFKYGVALILAIAFMAGCFNSKAEAQGPVSASVSYQTFYDDLSPYGTWIDYPAYGHVWHPNINGDFRPYLTNGYWDYSSEGWMWMSNYNWGWAPFHYGRWLYDDLYGWLWIPGYEWSPAWVTWGSVDNFYAWAPLMPGVNVGIQFGSWRPAAFYWNICDRNHIYDRNVYNFVEKRDLAVNYGNRINIITNFNTTRVHGQYYSKGPDVKEIEHFTNRKIEPASIRAVSTNAVARHQGNEIQVYRPAISHPQPREFRRINTNDANPVLRNEDRINTQQNQQMENIRRLPVHKAPESVFNNRQGNINHGNGGRKNRR
jgi:hypothetical protein